MLARFEARGIEHTRVAAIDGRDDAELVRAIRWSKTTPCEAACIASHLAAIRRAHDDGHARALILEDDTSFELLDARPEGFDAVMRALPERFGAVALAIAEEPKHLDRLFRRRDIVVKLGRRGFWSTGAYVIDRPGMSTLLRKYDRGDVFDVHPHHARHDAYSVVMRSLQAATDIAGPFLVRIPLFIFEGDDSEIHPEHLEEHRRARDFILANHRALVDGTYAPAFTARARAARLWAATVRRVRSFQSATSTAR
jgi:hypothetical protein